MLDSGQSTLFRGGGGEDIIDMLLKIWLSVPNVLATIVGIKSVFSHVVGHVITLDGQ